MRKTHLARSQIRTRFPWVRAVLALGAFYEGDTGQAGRLPRHVARYARGRDYHLVFQKRLKQLARALVAEGVCSRAHWHTDTGPVLERAWAEAAGLGWIGKNACLIHPQFGSFFLLAEILMDSTPAPDAPIPSRCGTCHRCLDACPTHALVAPGTLDARLCLATWNIECRGAMPLELWPAQREYVFGCDTCQTVCPYNADRSTGVPPVPGARHERDARATPDPELAAPRPWRQMTLAQCIVMSQSEYNRAFAASPLRRAGLKGLRLSAITVAGNLKCADCREALKQCLADEDQDIRRRAQWASGQSST
jgi:epoxyqueuosine reductase